MWMEKHKKNSIGNTWINTDCPEDGSWSVSLCGSEEGLRVWMCILIINIYSRCRRTLWLWSHWDNVFWTSNLLCTLWNWLLSFTSQGKRASRSSIKYLYMPRRRKLGFFRALRMGDKFAWMLLFIKRDMSGIKKSLPFTTFHNIMLMVFLAKSICGFRMTFQSWRDHLKIRDLCWTQRICNLLQIHYPSIRKMQKNTMQF